jgi:methylmalonyl-CoA mutase N-terminal domain/subunit
MDEEVRAALSRIRPRIEAERGIMAALKVGLNQEPMRQFLKRATHHVDDAESILRGVEESVTPWVLIRGSDLFLSLATEHRQKVEEARHTYGPEVTVVG